MGTKPGGHRHYSDTAIETDLTVRAVYGLALRQTEGFLRSVARLLRLDIDIPDHTTLSRRSSALKVHGRNPDTAGSPVHILIDSTGMKSHRGPTAPADGRNRRTWRKLHLVDDATTAEILCVANSYFSHKFLKMPRLSIAGSFTVVVKTKRRNPSWGCRRIAQRLFLVFGIDRQGSAEKIASLQRILQSSALPQICHSANVIQRDGT